MKEFIEYIIKNLVDRPEEVTVQCYEGDKGLIVDVKVAAGDMGKVVGSKGSIINAIRTIAVTICTRLGMGRIKINLLP